MKVMTVLGTRPEIIRLSRVIELLDRYAEKHWLVHTGQNFDERLSGLFFSELGVREPDVYMRIRASSFGQQAAQILEKSEALFLEYRPDRLLILGDTNSGLSAIVARRLGIPVYHMEAGNRCFDDRVPEEVNRRIIDHSSTVLMPYTELSRKNLLAEGFEGKRVFVTGNPIKQVIDSHTKKIAASGALDQYGVEKGKYFLATFHRAENVDQEDRLRHLITAFIELHREYGYPVVGSVHPRTRSKIGMFGIDTSEGGLRFVEPMGFFDFVFLEQNAFCLLSDSGTVQEEACIFGVPNVTLRDVTERPETVECGSNFLSGVQPAAIRRAVRQVVEQRGRWRAPAEYCEPFVAETVCRIVLSYRVPDLSEIEWRERQHA
jgi:UDP-N-acetylglucosamine 2-epimerase (non-hydrolysing)